MQQFIRFRQLDPHYANRAEEVIVAVAQVVKIEPVYYEEPEDGRRSPVKPAGKGETRKLVRVLRVHDALGNVYDSSTASEAGRCLLEQMWDAAF
jgi:hypothetical protein